MGDTIAIISDDFWNIRGSFKVGGVLDVGTQASLVRLKRGSFVLLDAYTLTGQVRDEVLRHTNGGADVEAILNLHPFHTLHVRAMHAMFPKAALYGTARHRKRAPDLPWDPHTTDDPMLHARFADDMTFSVPRGVDLVPTNEAVHFASVLALHRASRTLHVDDTLSYFKLPLVGGAVALHPTLRAALQHRPGAAADFRAWGAELVAMCADVDHLCTAHARELPPRGEGVAPQVARALAKAEPTLRAHERRQG